jgi:hypothetical protein
MMVGMTKVDAMMEEATEEEPGQGVLMYAKN